jgi:multidrug resistance efflux pump
VVISAESPPVKLVARSSGRITLINGNDGEQVKAGQLIAVIENPSVSTDMYRLLDLAAFLDTVTDLPSAVYAISLPGDIQAGEVQSAYAQLYQGISAYRSDKSAEKAEKGRDILLSIRGAARQIRGQIAVWENRYVLRSPVTGQLNCFKVWKENQQVTAGDPVFIVTPPSLQYIAHMAIPVTKAAKIKAGQSVLISLQDYPSREFGMLKATVRSVSTVALDDTYPVKLNLENDSLTTTDRVIHLKPENTGTGEIITSDNTIFRLLFRKYER